MKSFKWLIAGLILIVVFAVGALMVFEATDKKVEPNVKIIAPELLYKKYSPKLGDSEAKVKIVEYFDPACGTCASFYPFVKQLMKDNPNQIQLELRYAPFHKGSDFVVMLLEASRLQNKFWPTLELLYNNQQLWTQQHVAVPQLVVELLSTSDLDMKRLEQDYQSEAIISRIKEDIENGKSIPVEKTPEFFVNGQPLPAFGYKQLEDLVSAEIKRQYR